MAGSREAGLRAAVTNKAKHGDDFYQRIGLESAQEWAKIPKDQRKPRGFLAMTPEKLSEVSRKGVKARRKNKS